MVPLRSNIYDHVCKIMTAGLLVRIDEDVVGRLWLDDKKRFCFQYDKEWLERSRVPLSLSLPLTESPKGQSPKGQVWTWTKVGSPVEQRSSPPRHGERRFCDR